MRNVLRIESNGGHRRVTSEDLLLMLRRNIRVARWAATLNALLGGWNVATIVWTNESLGPWLALGINVVCGAIFELTARRADRMVHR